LYPEYKYDGLDKTLYYNLDAESISKIDRFFPINLEKEDLTKVPDNYYDYIIVAHVIEHINCGEKIIDMLCKKINRDGYFYIEYPREKSKKFPSMKGTLNFYDDATHIRSYEIVLLRKIIEENNFEIISSGIKRDWLRIVGIPLMIIKSKIQLGYIRASIFWDILGFSNYILARKI
jgi:hypothetical protein